MSLSSRVANKIVDTVNTAFHAIGHANGMRMPKSTNNLEPIAWELLIAQHVARMAEKRKLKAEADAVKAGIINDKEKDPRPAGTKGMLYRGDVVDVMVEVRNAGNRVNSAKMGEYLVAHGVKQDLVDAAIEAATTQSKPAHVFTAMLAEETGGK